MCRIVMCLLPKCFLATRRDQTSFADRHSGLAVAQTRRYEIGPDLLRTISDNRSDIEPICLRKGNCLPRFDLRSKPRQNNTSRSQQAKYCQGCKRFDHLRLLTVAGSRSQCARGSVHNSHNNKEFHAIQLIFEWRGSSIEARREAVSRHRYLVLVSRPQNASW